VKIIFDVYPLLNSNYTGIPQTTWHMARYLTSRRGEIDCLFTIGYRILEDADINALIRARSGHGIGEVLAFKAGRMLSLTDLSNRLYLSPHVMSIFSTHCLGRARIVHDISSITMPEFHHPHTVRTDGGNLRVDIDASDIIFTVSESSKAELVSYLGVAAERINVVYPGVEWHASQWKHAARRLVDSPYVLLFSTREPRKNLSFVMDYLICNIDSILRSNTTYVFAGPAGWGEDVGSIGDGKIQRLILAGKVLFTGFIAEELKLSLMAHARYMIFPSLFEGFGSPVAESLSVGTPVLCSCGGSLPEVGGNAARYFIPDSIESFTNAILAMELAISGDPIGERQRALEQGSKFTWEVFCSKLFGLLAQQYEELVWARKND